MQDCLVYSSSDSAVNRANGAAAMYYTDDTASACYRAAGSPEPFLPGEQLNLKVTGCGRPLNERGEQNTGHIRVPRSGP